MTAPTRLDMASGSVAYVAMPYRAVLEDIAKHRRRGHPKVALGGRWFVIADVVAVHPPVEHAEVAVGARVGGRMPIAVNVQFGDDRPSAFPPPRSVGLPGDGLRGEGCHA